MAAAIATIGANGLYCTPTIVDKVVVPDGKDAPGQQRACAQVIAPNIAATVAYALSAVMTSGTGSPGQPRDGVPIVGKTGTTDDSAQNWLVATTTKASLAVWVGNTDGGRHSLRKTTIAGTDGYNTKFNIFRTTLAALNTDPHYRGGAFPAPDPGLLLGQGVPVPNLAGDSSRTAQRALASHGLRFVDGGRVVSGLSGGNIVRSSPAAGSLVSTGTAVTVYTSDGSLAITMPDEIGKPRSAAVDELVHRGFSRENIRFP